jgi:DNA-binding CsgD family transcriptional regulator
LRRRARGHSLEPVVSEPTGAPSAARTRNDLHLVAAGRSLRRELAVDRLSIALVDPLAETFRIVAWDGKGLLAAGTELPLATSTQVGAAARGEQYAASDFRNAPGWDRASDRLMLAVGFVSGCSVPLRHGCGEIYGVASLSATQILDYDGRCAVLAAAAPGLAGLLWPADAPPPPHLTRRERELLPLLESGLRFKQIARELSISEPTAKGYARDLFRKLGASSRAEAVFEARRQGLL